MFAALNAAFDEKTLFPKYILDYEARMKHYHAKAISETPSVCCLIAAC